VAGTLVHTERGLLPIEKVRVGAMVLSQPEGGGERAYRRVTDTMSSDDIAVLEVAFETADGIQETLLATRDHPFWVQDMGWRALVTVEMGHKLQLGNGRDATVVSVRDTGAKQRVFTLSVDGFHTYCVRQYVAWGCIMRAPSTVSVAPPVMRPVRVSRWFVAVAWPLQRSLMSTVVL
jgi:Pretoxin HINT domain